MSAARIERCIHLIRGQRIMLDADLAPLTILRSQTVISSLGHGGRRYRPYAFYRAGHRDAFQRTSEPAGDSGQYRDHEDVCEAPKDAGIS